MGNQHLKIMGENAAAAYLEARGLEVLNRNWRRPWGELDLVAKDKDCLVFVEVKARATDRYLLPEISVDHAKRRKLRRLAEAYISFESPEFDECRFDVIAVVVSRRLIRHIPDAF